MAPAPRGPLTPAERQALKAKIAAAAAAKGVADDKAKYGRTSGRLVKKTPEYTPTKVKAGSTTVHTKTRVPTTVVQGATTSPAQREAARKAEVARRESRASRATTPQVEKPKNTNYKPKPKATLKGKTPKEIVKPKTLATGKTPNHYADALAAIRKEYADKAAAADKRKSPPVKENVQKVKSPASKNLAEAMDKRDAQDRANVAKRKAAPKKAPAKGVKKTSYEAEPSNRRGGHYAYDGTREGARIANDRAQWLRDHPEHTPFDRYGSKQKVKGKLPSTPKSPKAPGKKLNSQPGPGAPTGGTGRDADGGKGRTQFEDDRRGRMQGGADRPPIYRPQDDGQRGGYINRSDRGKGGGTISTGGSARGPVRAPKPPVIPARGSGGVLKTDTRTIVPAKPKKKLPVTGGSSVVKGLLR